jgi:hypothetical protein
MVVLLRVPEVDDPDFVAELSHAEGHLLRLVGSADKTTTEAIGAMLARVHAELCRRAARSVVVDLHGVDAMSARAFRQLLAWVESVQVLAPAERYRIRLRGNPALAWQQHGLAALACFDTDVVAIEAP